jgi:hypothetical protein
VESQIGKQEAWAAIQPMDCNMSKARLTKFEAAGGAVNARAAVEAMRSQRVLSLTLRTLVGPVTIGVGNLFGIPLDGTSKGV